MLVACSPPVAMPESGVLLAIDYGTRKTGVAIGHRLTGSARPLEPIRYRRPEALISGLAEVIGQWQPERIVVGLPLDGHGQETSMSRAIRRFAVSLSTIAPDCPVEFHDERMSSEQAARGYAERRGQGRARRRDVERLDSMAAAVILESWMSQHG
ncbi:MAG: Holliday junction resolvase RuvX [Wenzhouxiangella sp.]|nr:Holliday junction resolvase RuvX [Wenzhouxiangella sp.]